MQLVNKIDESKKDTKNFFSNFILFILKRTMDQFLNRFTKQYDDMNISSDDDEKKNRMSFHFSLL